MNTGSVNVSVAKNPNESTPSLMRRFSKKVQSSGIVRKAKSSRYHTRVVSKNKRKDGALRRIVKQEDRAEKEKMGLIQPRTFRGGKRK